MNYYIKLINFLKRNGINNETMFNYLYDKTKIIDYTTEEQREIRGVYPKYDKQKKLNDITLYIDVNNDESILLSIRPYCNLGTLYNPDKDIEAETLAIYFEKLYIKENPELIYKTYLDNIYSSIMEENDNSIHKIALITEQRLENTNYNTSCFEELYEKAKALRLTRKR